MKYCRWKKPLLIECTDGKKFEFLAGECYQYYFEKDKQYEDDAEFGGMPLNRKILVILIHGENGINIGYDDWNDFYRDYYEYIEEKDYKNYLISKRFDL
jgi:hypothetical protein